MHALRTNTHMRFLRFLSHVRMEGVAGYEYMKAPVI